MVVEEENDEDGEGSQWALYFDVEDDGLRDRIPPDRRVLEVELVRKEMRIPPVEEEDKGPE